MSGGQQGEGGSPSKASNQESGAASDESGFARNEQSQLSDEAVLAQLEAEECTTGAVRCINDIAYRCYERDPYGEYEAGWDTTSAVDCPLLSDEDCSAIAAQRTEIEQGLDRSCEVDDDCELYGEIPPDPCSCQPRPRYRVFAVTADVGALSDVERRYTRGGCDGRPQYLTPRDDDYECDAAPPEPYCGDGRCGLEGRSCLGPR